MTHARPEHPPKQDRRQAEHGQLLTSLASFAYPDLIAYTYFAYAGISLIAFISQNVQLSGVRSLCCNDRIPSLIYPPNMPVVEKA